MGFKDWCYRMLTPIPQGRGKNLEQPAGSQQEKGLAGAAGKGWRG
ncbi:hypothetical protein [Lelliottia amnigena]